MRVDSINITNFKSKKITPLKDLRRLSHNPKFTSTKIIKTYSQYLKECRLDLKSRKK